MSTDNELTKKEKRIKKENDSYQKIIDKCRASVGKQESFLSKNDERLNSLRKRNEEILNKHRQMYDARLSKRRKIIEDKIIKDDSGRREKFVRQTEKTDEFINGHRKKQDELRNRHRESVDLKHKKRRYKILSFLEDEKEKLNNIIMRNRNEKGFHYRKRRLFFLVFGLLLAVIMFFAVEHILPGSKLKRDEVIEDTPIEEAVEIIPEKEYDKLVELTEEQYLYKALMEHFEGNETAVLGVMCNIRAESHFEAGNLEDYNNDIWDIDDVSYTEKVNRKTINKKDFAESRKDNMTNGYYNEYGQWVNLDGGYGFAQYTAHSKKEELYLFAERWYGPGGEGEGYKFNIGDPKMQAEYIVYLLESDDFSKLDSLIRNAGSIVDACYYWLKYYEIPYDPYCDDYYTLAFERADNAEDIKENCSDVMESFNDLETYDNEIQ